MSSEYEILLVEDSPYDAELTIRALLSKNISNALLHVKDGEEALDFIHSRGKFLERGEGNYPHLILLDLKLPKIGGIEVLKELKSDDKTKKIPTIVFTSSKEISDISECYRLGVNSYIVKPVDFDVYTTMVGHAGIYWTQINQSFR
jgi:two-component system, response regulator